MDNITNDKNESVESNIVNTQVGAQHNNNFNSYILNGSQINTYIDPSLSKLNIYLENEKDNINKLGWSKMSKMNKMIKLEEYINEEYPLITPSFNKKILLFLKDNVDNKKMNKIQDVIYNKELGTITKIPELIINVKLKTYSYKKNDRKKSTLKNLPPKKKSPV
jgi:hypothetical protein